MQWLRWATTAGPLAGPWARFLQIADRVARLVAHAVALGVAFDAIARLFVGRHDLLGMGIIVAFALVAAAVGLVVKARESRLTLRAHVDELALGLAGIVITYFAATVAAARL